MKQKKFVVTLKAPNNATIADIKKYIKDALMIHCGSIKPDDPMFYFPGRESIKVVSFREPKPHWYLDSKHAISADDLI